VTAPLDVTGSLATAILALPIASLLWLGALMLFGRTPTERTISTVSGGALLLALLCAIGVLGDMVVHDVDLVQVPLGSWFEVGVYRFDAVLLVDKLSLPFIFLTCILCGVVGRFSRSYLHRDAGFARFYLLLLVFAAGMLLIVMAGSIDLLFAGWELVGITSALLIAFFNRRAEPVRNGLRAFATYRVCDVGLLVGAVLIHHYAHTSDFEVAFDHGHFPEGLSHLDGGAATIVALLFVFASLGKSAQLPFSGWLPRAMEGPTPSSAIFYGGLSIHAGAYLLLRISPILDRSPFAAAVLVAIGLVTAAYATLVGRVQSDAKNQLAYASIAQVGLILAEIGLGLRLLAVVHIAGHAAVRTLQFLRAPSLLHELHLMHGAAGGELSPTGAHYERLLPARARRWLYALAVQRTVIDSALERFVVAPVMLLARALDDAERRLASAFEPAKPAPLPAPPPHPVAALPSHAKDVD
jgi:NADH-quinone oxidoreductase subunit L